MIYVKHGATSISGAKDVLMAEFTVLLKNLKNFHIFNDEDIDECFKISKMSSEEIRAENERLMKELMKEDNDIDHMIKEIIDSIL